MRFHDRVALRKARARIDGALATPEGQADLRRRAKPLVPEPEWKIKARQLVKKASPAQRFMGLLRRRRRPAAAEAEMDEAQLERRRIVAEANGTEEMRDENIDDNNNDEKTARTPRTPRGPQPQNLEEAMALVEQGDREAAYKEAWGKALHRFRKRRPPVYCCRNPECLTGFGTAEDLKEHLLATGISGPALPGEKKGADSMYPPCLGRVGVPWVILEDVQFYQSPTRALQEV